MNSSSQHTQESEGSEDRTHFGTAQDAYRAAQHDGLDVGQIQALLRADDLLDVADPQQAVWHLTHIVPCFVGGLLLANGRHGQIVLACARPADDLFLEAVQQRLLASYRLYAGSSKADPEMQVSVHGDCISGPYELPRSMLTVPLLYQGRVFGAFIVASVFRNTFQSGDLCAMSILAARMAASLHAVCLT